MQKFIFKLCLMFLILACATPSHACSVCFGDSKSSTMQGVTWGIIFLLVVLGLVASLFTYFFIEFQKRAKAMPKP